MVIVAASLGIVTLREVAMPKMAHGQVDITLLTPEQKAAICDPSDTHINATLTSPSIPSSGLTTTADTTGAFIAITTSSTNTTSSRTILRFRGISSQKQPKGDTFSTLLATL